MPQRLFKLSPLPRRLVPLVLCGICLAFFMDETRAMAEESSVPWECSEYSGEAQTRCMNTLLELQQKRIAELENQLKAQEETVNDLQEKLDRQAAVAKREARTRADKEDSKYSFDSYRYPYSGFYGYRLIPPLGLYLGPPWRYPRYYGYGPGYWGAPGLSFHFGFGGGHRHRHR